MQNPYLIRTAAVVTLAAAVVGAGWMGMQSDDMSVVEPGTVPVAVEAEPAFHFPAGYTLQSDPDEPEIYEFY
jgi:hypothetical protein